MAEKELTYESAFPGRFLKAALFEGRQVTLTIETAFMEQLEGDKGVENKLILAFVGKTLQLVCNKTNAYCLKEMFGNKVAAWVGKRVTFYPTETNFGPKKVDAIRIYGSPDIEANVEVAARIGRKNLKMTMHKVAKNGNANSAAPKPPATALDPRLEGAFELLGWTAPERAQFLAQYANATVTELLTLLNSTIDQLNSQEA